MPVSAGSTTARSPRRGGGSPAWWGVIAATIVGAVLVAGVFGAPAQVGPGATEQAQGADVGEAGPAYWVWEASQVVTIPTPVPGAISTVMTAPTVLPAGSTPYRIDPATAGNTSVRWEFSEETTAPRSTELELRFTVGLSRQAVHITAYLETQSAALAAAILFYAYWDAGAFSPSSLSVETMQVDVLVCTAVGVCP